MRKQMVLLLITVVWLGVMSVGAAAAQTNDTLKLGEFTKGSITDQAYEVRYSFSGKKGDVVTLEMLLDPQQHDSSLDPAVELRDSSGQTLAYNKSFSWPLVLAIAELPADGDYTAVAGREDGVMGKSVGDFILRVSVAKLVDRGTNISAKVSSDVEAPPQIYIMRPEKDIPLEINFRQEQGDLYASLSLVRWLPDGYPDSIVNLDGTSGLNRALLFTNLTAGYFYVFILQQGSEAMRDPVDFPVTIGLI